MTSKESARPMDVDHSDVVSSVSPDTALAEFVALLYDRLVRLARLVCRDGVDAGDAVHVRLEQAWRRRSSLRDDARLRPWLDRIVVREAIPIGRSRQSWLGRVFAPGSDVAWIEPVGLTTEQLSAWSALRNRLVGHRSRRSSLDNRVRRQHAQRRGRDHTEVAGRAESSGWFPGVRRSSLRAVAYFTRTDRLADRPGMARSRPRPWHR